MPARPMSSTPRELIVVTREDASIFSTGTSLLAAPGVSTSTLTQLLTAELAVLRPLFGVAPRALAAQLGTAPASALAVELGLARYHHVVAPAQRLDALAARLRSLPMVEAAYVRSGAELAFRGGQGLPNAPGNHTGVTEDLHELQRYLGPAPEGIDAHHAWMLPGGKGKNVRVVDMEFGWRFDHEDLLENFGGLIAGRIDDDGGSIEHGTGVFGVLGGDDNPIGVTGICPEALLRAIALTVQPEMTPFSLDKPIASRIYESAQRLRPGDILLLEVHMAGPRVQFQWNEQQNGYIAVEWWPDTFAAIRYATASAIIVVEAAGNGGEDLDHPDYDNAHESFHSRWLNPFNPDNPSSGAILVGAGAPPPGTSGENWGPDRSRLDFSNYGTRVDAQGWGRSVTTCGGGDLRFGHDPRRWYTRTFAGTSSASPIVAGALACLQGVLRARGRPALGPEEAMDLLRRTGSPQQDAPGRPRSQRIGNRPDLRKLIAAID